jgi:hypothetical protein
MSGFEDEVENVCVANPSFDLHLHDVTPDSSV